MTLKRSLIFNGNRVQKIEATEALGHIPWSTWLFTSRPCTRFKVAASNSNNTSTFIEEIQRYECLYDKLSKDYKNRRTRENVSETIGQKFGLTAEAVPKTDASFDVLSSSSSQNITENQITSQKSSSIDSRHFNFDLGGKKIPIASLFYRLIRYKRFNGNQGIARIASITSVVFSPREALFKRQRRF